MNNELAKLLARLTALKNNIPNNHWTDEKYANEFNSIVIDLEKISSQKLGEFKVPENEIVHKVTSWGRGSETYSSQKYCDREYILMKIDGILGYFTLSLQPEETKNKFGFTVEEK